MPCPDSFLLPCSSSPQLSTASPVRSLAHPLPHLHLHLHLTLPPLTLLLLSPFSPRQHHRSYSTTLVRSSTSSSSSCGSPLPTLFIHIRPHLNNLQPLLSPNPSTLSSSIRHPIIHSRARKGPPDRIFRRELVWTLQQPRDETPPRKLPAHSISPFSILSYNPSRTPGLSLHFNRIFRPIIRARQLLSQTAVAIVAQPHLTSSHLDLNLLPQQINTIADTDAGSLEYIPGTFANNWSRVLGSSQFGFVVCFARQLQDRLNDFLRQPTSFTVQILYLLDRSQLNQILLYLTFCNRITVCSGLSVTASLSRSLASATNTTHPPTFLSKQQDVL